MLVYPGSKRVSSLPKRRAPVAGFGVPGEARLAGVIEQPGCVPDIALHKQEAIRTHGEKELLSSRGKATQEIPRLALPLAIVAVTVSPAQIAPRHTCLETAPFHLADARLARAAVPALLSL